MMQEEALNADLMQAVIQITREAGEIILSYYKGAVDVQEKSPDNPVTEADFAADAHLREKLRALMPSAGWLSEETADSPDRLDKRRIWVVDPLDGTKEFILGIPEFTISVALVEDGIPVLACILNPVSQELFHAIKGQGGRYNDKPLAASRRSELAGASVEASRSERKRGEFEPFEGIFEITTMGSIAYKLARAAAGLADLTWSRGPKWEWDICAGVLLVQEASGRCVDLDNEEMRFNKSWPKVNGIIASNGVLHADLIDTLAPYRDSARKDK